jgi:putative protease
MNEELEKIGEIVHFFGDINVGVIKATEKELEVGDKIRIIGSTTDLEQTVDSLQVDKENVEKIKKGEEAGMKVEGRVREGDEVFSLN